jgi:hypothetical protein
MAPARHEEIRHEIAREPGKRFGQEDGARNQQAMSSQHEQHTAGEALRLTLGRKPPPSRAAKQQPRHPQDNTDHDGTMPPSFAPAQNIPFASGRVF